MENSKIKIGDEDWTVRYFRQVFHPKTHKYCRAARVPHRKEVWLSLNDESNNKFDKQVVASNLTQAITPLVIEATKQKYGEEAVNAAVQSLGIKV